MIVVIVASLLCLLLTSFEVKWSAKNGMAYGFAIITIIQCLRFDYGTDYIGYYYGFLDYVNSSYSIHDVFTANFRRNNEFGWAFLQWLFAHLGWWGFFIMNLVLCVFENTVIYYFIRNNVDKKHWIFPVFIFLFTSSFYLLSFSMLRQWLAMCLFICAYHFFKQRKILPAFFIVYVASTIHRSALLIIPFVFFGLLPLKRKSVYGFVFIALFLILSFSGNALDSLLELFMGVEAVEGYVNSYGERQDTSRGIGFVINLIPFLVSLYYLFTSDFKNKQDVLLVVISCLGTMLIPFMGKLEMVSRLSLYFSVFTIASVPITYYHLNNRYLRTGLIVIFVFMHLYAYLFFFKDPSYIEKYAIYKTIFSAF